MGHFILCKVSLQTSFNLRNSSEIGRINIFHSIFLSGDKFRLTEFKWLPQGHFSTAHVSQLLV